ncbi:MAG: putative PIG3 family NAD(P)H quinone oxidoreductase [Myxococcota bacterium]|jgi:putative PIG3 family NAD(P)H quinone oxidoreductase
MHAIQIDPTTKALRWAEAPTPAPGPGELRIRVHATAVNRADLVQRAGRYNPPPGASQILGLECAGIVDAVGPGPCRFQPGDRACALLSGGGYAEQVVVPTGQALPIPDGMSFTEAAALPEVLTTAWLNLYREGALQPGEHVLLHAGASGVGTMALQLLRRTGNPAFVTVGSPEKIARCMALGAEGGFDRHGGSFAPAVAEWTGGRGVDVILDPVGADYLDDNLRSLATCGRMVLIGLLSGRSASLDMGQILVRRLQVKGSVLRARSIEEKADIIAGLEADVWPAVASGQILPIIDRVMPIAEAEQAHTVIRSNVTVGKVILTVP